MSTRNLVSEVLNKCNSNTKQDTIYTKYGFIDIHRVENKKVELVFNQYSNGEDDYDDELVEVKIDEKIYA